MKRIAKESKDEAVKAQPSQVLEDSKHGINRISPKGVCSAKKEISTDENTCKATQVESHSLLSESTPDECLRNTSDLIKKLKQTPALRKMSKPMCNTHELEYHCEKTSMINTFSDFYKYLSPLKPEFMLSLLWHQQQKLKNFARTSASTSNNASTSRQDVYRPLSVRDLLSDDIEDAVVQPPQQRNNMMDKLYYPPSFTDSSLLSNSTGPSTCINSNIENREYYFQLANVIKLKSEAILQEAKVILKNASKNRNTEKLQQSSKCTIYI